MKMPFGFRLYKNLFKNHADVSGRKDKLKEIGVQRCAEKCIKFHTFHVAQYAIWLTTEVFLDPSPTILFEPKSIFTCHGVFDDTI